MEKYILFILIALGILLVFKLFSLRIRLIFRLLLNIAAGFIFLVILNYIGAFIGLSLGINIFTALITGILGLPGVILLLLICAL